MGFWTWTNLKLVYAALAIIVIVAICAGWAVQRLGAPDWVWSAICLTAFVGWVAVGVFAAVKQARENRTQDRWKRR